MSDESPERISVTGLSPGFRQSVQMRLILTLAFFIFSAAAIIMVERLSAASIQPTIERVEKPEGQTGSLTITTDFEPVAMMIMIDQVVIKGTESEATPFQFEYPIENLNTESEFFVSLESENFFGDEDDTVEISITLDSSTATTSLNGQGMIIRSDTVQNWFPEL